MNRAISDLGVPANDLPGELTPSEASLSTVARVMKERSDIVFQSLRSLEEPPAPALEAALADIAGTHWFSWTVPVDHGPWDPCRHAFNRRQIHPALVALAGRGELPGAERAAPLLRYTGDEVAWAVTASPAAPLQTCSQVITDAIHYVRVAASQASEILSAKRLQADQRQQTAAQTKQRSRHGGRRPRTATQQPRPAQTWKRSAAGSPEAEPPADETNIPRPVGAASGAAMKRSQPAARRPDHAKVQRRGERRDES